VLFHMPTADRKEGARMVRLGNAGKEVFWGYYDATGVFVGQGGSAIDLDPMTYHTLSVVANPETYSIQLNGETLVTDVPLQQSSGWIGLLSYSGPVDFRNIRLQLGEPSP